MKETLEKETVENDDAKVAAEITEAMQNTQSEESADPRASAPEKPYIDVDALARALREAEERGYQRAVNEAAEARKARQQRTFAMPASDTVTPTSSPTILNGLKPGFWER